MDRRQGYEPSGGSIMEPPCCNTIHSLPIFSISALNVVLKIVFSTEKSQKAKIREAGGRLSCKNDLVLSKSGILSWGSVFEYCGSKIYG